MGAGDRPRARVGLGGDPGRLPGFASGLRPLSRGPGALEPGVARDAYPRGGDRDRARSRARAEARRSRGGRAATAAPGSRSKRWGRPGRGELGRPNGLGISGGRCARWRCGERTRDARVGEGRPPSARRGGRRHSPAPQTSAATGSQRKMEAAGPRRRGPRRGCAQGVGVAASARGSPARAAAVTTLRPVCAPPSPSELQSLLP